MIWYHLNESWELRNGGIDGTNKLIHYQDGSSIHLTVHSQCIMHTCICNFMSTKVDNRNDLHQFMDRTIHFSFTVHMLLLYFWKHVFVMLKFYTLSLGFCQNAMQPYLLQDFYKWSKAQWQLFLSTYTASAVCFAIWVFQCMYNPSSKTISKT